jgi:hypothetical protein
MLDHAREAVELATSCGKSCPMVMRDVSTIDLYALDWEAP